MRGIIQLVGLVILVISKGFVEFNSRRMTERLVRVDAVGQGAIRMVGFAS